jgi:hypothetical protein
MSPAQEIKQKCAVSTSEQGPPFTPWVIPGTSIWDCVVLKKTGLMLGPLERANLKTETDLVSETFSSYVFRIPDNGQNPQTQRLCMYLYVSLQRTA